MVIFKPYQLNIWCGFYFGNLGNYSAIFFLLPKDTILTVILHHKYKTTVKRVIH